jgi:parvulin-like peptidyl-prolyl isomerase
MAKRNKGAVEEVQRELTRKEERLRQRDRERHRMLYTVLGIAIGAALLLVIVGIVYQLVFVPNRAVATVGEETIAARDFQKRAKLEQSSLQNQLLQYTQMEQQFGNQGFFTNQINQLQATLSSPFALGQQTLDNMIRELVIEREAAARNITVTDEEVEEALREEIANARGLVTVPQATATAQAAADATATAALWTPTPEPTLEASAAVTATEGVTATGEVTGTAAVTDTGAVTESVEEATPTPVPPAAIISDTALSEGLQSLEESISTVAGMTLAEYRDIIRVRLLSEKLAEVIGEEQVAATSEQVHARHILLREITPTPEPTPLPEGEPTPEPTPTATALPEGAPTPTPTPAPRTREEALALATELRGRLEQGEDFAALAEEYSDDTGSAVQGGDLGWFAQGMMVAPFDEAAFSLPVGEISEPISTTFGIHLIEVLEKDPEHAKDVAQLQQERAQAYDAWLQEQVAALQVERGDVVANLPRELQ